MRCAKCDARTTEVTWANGLRRRRVCPKGHAFQTVEVAVASQGNAFAKAQHAAARDVLGSIENQIADMRRNIARSVLREKGYLA